jgi:hypothetical protein
MSLTRIGTCHAEAEGEGGCYDSASSQDAGANP